MERYIKYKRFNEVHTQHTIQDFFDRLITDGWEIIYYEEMRKSSGPLTDSSTEEITIHVTIVAGKKQDLKQVL